VEFFQNGFAGRPWSSGGIGTYCGSGRFGLASFRAMQTTPQCGETEVGSRRNPAAGPGVGEGRLSMHLRTSTNALANRLMASWIEASVTKMARVSAISKFLVSRRFPAEPGEAARGEAIPDVAKLAGTSLDARRSCPGVAAREAGRDRRSGQRRAGRSARRPGALRRRAAVSARPTFAAGSARQRARQLLQWVAPAELKRKL
jgi:hypothetical protein